MGWKEDWDELNKKKRAQKEAVADVTYRAYQQEREAQGFPSSSVSKGNDVVSAIQNGINSLTQPKKEFTWNMKTARQRLLELELPRENWYSGEKPTTSEALAQIWRIGQTDKEKASKLYDSFQLFRNDPTTAFYDPYSQATNRKIADITKYGIDVSGGINDDWFKKNAYLMNYYTYGSTNNPLGTAKSRSKEQNAAALYYDLLQDEEKTKKAENEWQALQDEVRYWTGRKDLNLSDQEILNRIDWNNYKTLSSMDESRENGAPIALNRAVGYSRDNLYGVIWEARNGQENGNITNDAVKYRLGAGNGYEENAEARARRDATSDYFNPYWNGIASDDMNETALYFGTDRFDQDWIDSHRYIMNGNDETAKREYLKVVAAEETTRKAEEEMKLLQDRVDSYIKLGITDPGKILDGILDTDEYNDEPALSTLKKLDESLGGYKMMNTTRALQYSYRDLKREVERRCEEEKSKQPSYQFAKDVEKQYGSGHMVPPSQVQNDTDRTNIVHEKTSEDAVNEARDRNIQENAETIRNTGTPEEKVVYGTASSSTYNRDVADTNAALQNGAVPAQTAVDVAVESANQYAGENYVGAITTVKQYEQDAQTLNTLKQQLEELKQKWGIGGSSSKVDMSKVVGSNASSGGKLNANGAAGSKNFGKGNIDLTKRIPVMNEDGTISTVDSFSVGMDIDGQQKEVLLPTIIDGKRVSEEEAIQHFEQTGEYLGIFDTVEEANEYAEQLHKDQEEMFERDFKKFEDENYDAMAEAWPQSADEDEYRQHMFEYYLRQKTGGDYAQYGEDAQTAIELERQIAELEQKQQEGQEGYEQAKDTVKNVYEQYGIQADISELTDTQAKNTIIRELDVLAPIMATYKPTQYSATSIFDAIIEGGYSKQEAAAYARQTLDQCRKDLDTLNHAVETAGPYIWITDNQQKQNIEREQARLERAIQEAQDFLLRDEGDFNKTAAKGMEKAKEALYDKNGKPAYGFMNFGHDGYSELDRAVLDPQWTYDQWTSDGSTKYYLSLQMSDDERATYFYIREKQGEEAAKEYYKRLADDTYGALQVRHSEETAQKNAEFAGSGVVQNLLANAVKVLMAPGKAVAGIYSFYNLMTGQDVNPYSAYYAVNNMSNTIAQTTHEKLNDAFGEGTTGAKVAGFLYDALSSAAESGMTAILTGGISLGSEQAATFLGKFGLKAAESFIAAAPMSIGAMGDTIQQALADGATPEQALLKGAASFLSETISEGISIGNITDAFDKGLADPKSFVDFIKSVAKSSFEEGSEEIVSGIFEDWTDQMIMGEMSKRAQMVKEYQKTVNPLTGQLYTEEEAKQLASRDIFEDILMQGLSGAVSGGVGVIGGYAGGAVTNAANRAVNNAEFRRQFKSGGKFIDNMVKETDAKVQAAETNYRQAEDAALKAREAANDTNLTAEEQQIAAAEADRLDQEAANAKAELDTAQQESEKATVDRDKWNALREGALQFHNDYQSMQQAEAAAQEAKGTKNETQRRKDADKAKEKYEKSKSEFRKQYSDMAESGIAEQLGIKAEDLEADPVEAANAVFEAENVTETAEESTEAPAEEVTAPNAEQAAIEEKQPLTQEERERAQQKVNQLEAEARQAEKEATAANERAAEARKTARTENTEEARNAASIAQQEADQAQARAFEARKQANKAAQDDAILQALEGKTPQPRQNRFGIAVNKAEAQRVVNDVTALSEAASGDYGQAAQTAATAAVLADSAPGTMGSTAAQHMMDEYGSEKVLDGMRKILNTAVNRAGIALNDAKAAVVTAALNVNGRAHEILTGMMNGSVTAEGINALVQAAQEEAADPAVAKSMAEQDRENRIDQRSKELAGNDQSQAVAKAKEAVFSIKEKASNLRSMMNDLRTKYDNAGEYIWQLTQEYCKLSAEGKQDAADSVGNQRNNAYKQRASLKDSFNKAAQEFVDAQNALKKAMEDLRSARQQRENELRAQAIAEIDAEDAAAAQAMAEQQAAAEAAAQAVVDQGITAEEATIDEVNEQPTPPAERSDIQYSKNVRRSQDTNPQPAGTKPKVSPMQTAIDLADSLGVGHEFGTSRMGENPENAPAYYRRHAQSIAVKSSDAGNYITTMHEIWHHLGNILNMTGTQQMIDNMDPDLRADYKDKAELPDEAFGEFGWHYVQGDESARQFAGDAFVDDFERALRKSGYWDAVQKARGRIMDWVGSNLNDALGAVIRNKSEANKKKGSVEHMLSSFVDETSAAAQMKKEQRRQEGKEKLKANGNELDLDVDVRDNALLRNHSENVAKGQFTNALTDSNRTVIGESCAKRLEDAGLDGKDFDEFCKYWVVLHSLDRDIAKAPVFDNTKFTPEARRQYITEMNQSHPEFANAVKALQEFRHDFLQAWLVDTGYMTAKELARMEAKYPNYAPTFRIMDQQNGATGSGGRVFTIRQATGGTQDIINPMDSFVDMTRSIVTMVMNNRVGLAFDNAYKRYNGMGEFARDVTDEMTQAEKDMASVRQKIDGILNGDAGTDMLSDILNAIAGNEDSSNVRASSKVKIPNVITVVHPDGSKSYYRMYNPDLYNLIAGVRDNDIGPLLEKVAYANKFMSSMTTGSNPKFALRNFMRDFQNSVNYGSWASNYVTGAIKWVGSFYDVWKNKGSYEDYVALGGGGWNRIDTGTKAGAADYRSEMFKGYSTSNAKETAKTAGKKIWNAMTLARLNEIIEQASRYAEYKYGKHDLSTAEGRQRAFLAAQDATVDFSRRGSGRLAAELKAVIPFFGASLQGVYRTARMFTEEERGRLPARFAKTLLNAGITSAVCTALLKKFLTPKEKEEYEMMSDDLKSKHLYIPNFFKDMVEKWFPENETLRELVGNEPLIRIPLAQDPMTYAVNGLVSNAIWGETADDDDFLISLKAIGNTIADNLNPVGSGTIFNPLLAMSTNRNWYGGNIVPTRLQDLPDELQYTDETPDIFVTAGRMTGESPMKLQYLFEQYTGYLGQMLIPAVSKNEQTGKPGGWKATVAAARKSLTSDPLISNDIVSSFYDGAALMQDVVDAVGAGKPLNFLRRGLTEEEAKQAYTEAHNATLKGGFIKETKAAIGEIYDDIDRINADENLTSVEKYELTSQKRREMIQLTLDAQEEIGAWNAKYLDGKNVVLDRFTEGTTASKPTGEDTMPERFKNDSGKTYMQRAQQVFKATGKDSALPHPNTTFTKGGTEIDMTTGNYQTYLDKYAETYETAVSRIKNWDSLTDEEKLNKLKKAHSDAHAAGKQAWQAEWDKTH